MYYLLRISKLERFKKSNIWLKCFGHRSGEFCLVVQLHQVVPANKVNKKEIMQTTKLVL